MLSIFPGLLSYSLVGTTIIRLVVGFVVFYIGIVTVSTKKSSYETEMQIHNYPFSKTIPIIFGVAEIITGIFLVIGFLTQVMFLISIYFFFNLIFIDKHVGRVLNYPNVFYISMIFICIAGIFLGPGLYAIDMPL